MLPPTAISSRQKLHGLDHLRAFAIGYVFLYHYVLLSGGGPTWFPEMIRFGWSGVDLFFALSGFLIASGLFAEMGAGRQPSYRSFFLKRIFRILPAYWAVLAIYFLVPAFHEREALPPLWKFLSFTQNIGLDLRTSGTFSHAWSLCVEEHFYLLLPAVLYLGQKRGRIWWLAWLLPLLFAGGFIVRYFGYMQLYLPNEETGPVLWYKYLYYPTWNRLDGLLAGVSVAAAYRFCPVLWSRLSRYGNGLLLAGTTALAGAYFVCAGQASLAATVFGFPLTALGYGLLVAGAVSPGSILFRWKSGATSFIATISYALYLSHKGVVHVVRNLLEDLDWSETALFFVSLAACLLVAWMLHLAVERPFLKWRDRILRFINDKHRK